MANYFKGVREANVFEKGNYLDPGFCYTLRVDRTFVKETREQGDAFIVDFTVVKSDNPRQGEGVHATYYQGLRRKDIAGGALKLFTYAVMGLDTVKDAEKIRKEVDPNIETLLEEACTKNTFQGQILNVRTGSRKSKTTGTDITTHSWSPKT